MSKGGGEGGMDFKRLEEKDREIQTEEGWRKIRESRFNKWYGCIKGEGIPGYIKKVGEK